MLKSAMENPEYLKQMGGLGDQFGEALEQMMKMSPDELAVQLEAAMKMMTDSDIVDNIVGKKDEVIQSLEASGAVTPEELARYKTDPAYFELKMRESFEQMGDLLQNPEYIAKAAEVMKDMGKVMGDPDALSNVMKIMGEGMQDEGHVEDARQKFLAGDFGGMPGMKEMFDTPEMKAILKDPAKWKATVKEGFDGMMGGLDGAKAEL